MYISIIADIQSSRKIDDRYTIQEKLIKVFSKLNKNKNIISPYTITLGDEFQVVYISVESLFHDIFQIMLEVYPIFIRFSIGIGSISTRINKKQALGMDGPAFYLARDKLNKLKKSNSLIGIVSGKKIDNFLNEVLSIVSHNSRKWGKNRFAILVMLLKNRSINEISGKLNLSNQSIYKNIKDGNLRSIVLVLREIEFYIEGIIDEKTKNIP
jgi:hypothetical protein